MRHIEFSVECIAEAPQRIFVGGMVLRDPIRLGDQFKLVIRRVGAEALNPPRYVHATVRGIVTYRKRMNQVSSGMSAELELEIAEHVKLALEETLIGDESTALFSEYEVLGDGEFHIKPR